MQFSGPFSRPVDGDFALQSPPVCRIMDIRKTAVRAACLMERMRSHGRKKVFHIGDRASFSKTISESDVYAFAGITGDFNGLHMNAEFARHTRYGKRIVHGNIPASFISTAMGMSLPGPGAIFIDQSTKFLKPVYYNDTITANIQLIEARTKSEFYVCTIKGECRNQHGEIVIVSVCHEMISMDEVEIVQDDED